MRTHAVLYTDILVIGAGAAASRAALESERAGADTVMITKRRFGSAGTSTFRVAESAGFSASGDLSEYRAKAIILATGGAGCLFEETLNPVDITGDGYAPGARAGARLVNMEFMQSDLGVIEPAKTIFNAWIWSLCPDIQNSSGEDFITKYLPDGVTLQDCIAAKDGHYPFSTRDLSRYIEIAVKKEGNRGEGVYADPRKVPPLSEIDNMNLAQMWPITKAWMQKCGADPDNSILRLTCYAHAFNGGLLIDEHAETTVPRLLAVGETAGGPHGADRLGGNMFSSGQVFGEIAGKYAAGLARESDFPARRETAPPSIPWGGGPGEARLDAWRGRLQRLASRDLLVVRTGEGLRHYQEEARLLEEELSSAAVSSGREAQKLLELKNLLLTGRLVAQAALKRTESRGSHYREDFPAMSEDPMWRKAIALENGNCSMEEL